MGSHRQGITVDKILRKHMEGGAEEVVLRGEVQVGGENFQQVGAALGDVVREEFDAVEAHEREQGEVPFLEIRLAVSQFYGGQLTLEDLHREIAAAARGFEEAGVDALGFSLYQIEHRLDQPFGGENLPVVGDALFRFYEAHEVNCVI